MPITISGSGTIAGLTTGGLPDGSIAAADIAAGVIPAAFSLSNAEDGTGTDFEFNSGYGSNATAYACRAWIHFNGGSSSIGTGDASGNVSSVTDNNTGDYTINFTNSMPDGNYVIFGTATWTTTWGANIYAFRDTTGGYPGTGGFRIYVANSTDYSAIDPIDVMVGVVR